MALVTITRDKVTIEEIDDSLLEKTEGYFEDEKEVTNWSEYRLLGTPSPRVAHGICIDCLDGVCKHIHRSVHVRLKEGVAAKTEVQNLI